MMLNLRKLITLILIMTLLWQPPLHAYYDALRPKAAKEREIDGMTYAAMARIQAIDRFVTEQIREVNDQKLIREFLTEGKVVVKASDGAKFLFSINNLQWEDGKGSYGTPFYNIDIQEMAGGRTVLSVGHCIFEFQHKIAVCDSDPLKRYGNKEAIKVLEPFGKLYRGIGSTAIQLARYYAAFKKADAFTVIDLSESDYLARLKFTGDTFRFDQSSRPFIDTGVPRIEIIAEPRVHSTKRANEALSSI